MVTGVVMHAGLNPGGDSHTTERHVLRVFVQLSAPGIGPWPYVAHFGVGNPRPQWCLSAGSCSSATSEAASAATVICIAWANGN
jgi:hypothetical protein